MIYEWENFITPHVKSATVPITIDDVALYWQGTDFEGDHVDPGKYIVKVRWDTKKKQGCACKDIYLN